MKQLRCGFTLVELLVVVGIIAIIIAFLMPALSRVRYQAQSVKCMSNLKQIGTAALMYAHDFHGQYPCDASGLDHDFRFMDWLGTGNPPVSGTDPIRLAIRDAMYKYAGKSAKVFFCPSNDMPAINLVLNRPYDENDFLDPNPGGTYAGRFGYWWVCTPYFPGSQDQDVSASHKYWHQDAIPESFLDGTTVPLATAQADPKYRCKVGIDYLRTTKDKNAANVAICVDQSRNAKSATDLTFWYYMHGSPKKVGCWKNELFGDGHCESRRPDQMKKRWNPVGVQAW